MNEVKELCARALDGPEPPLPDATEMLAVARRATRTRNRLRAGYGLAAVAALAVGAAVLGPEVIVADPQPPVVAAPPDVAASPPSSPAELPAAPTSEEAVAHVGRIAELLTDALPDGYSLVFASRTAGEPTPSGSWSPWYAELDDDSYAVTTTLLVSSGDGTGALQIVIRGDESGPSRDLCEPEIRAGFAVPAGSKCRLLELDDGPIWTITGEDAARGEVEAATRALDGGYLTLVAEQGIESEYFPMPLAAAPLTAPELAALLADPAILP